MHYFAALSMNRKRKIYSLFNKVSAICMIMALLWLTVSLPFIFSAEQELASTEKTTSGVPGNDDESADPFGSSTEEKAPSSTSFSEEYLHDHSAHEYLSLNTLIHHVCGNAGTYIAFHGELLVPPPNAA
ncbi:MAG: hypothetical protein HOP10_03295 [Chitinophagaceae bacterium]|nr:hypothetical protein [Chitinophagaceae bacterium]